MSSFVELLPKAELHVHLEGTLEPEHIFELAGRNGVSLPYASPQAVIDAYNFDDLPSFLKMYYAGMDVLRTEQDFYELTYRYFERAAADNVRYVEPFFDPQGHTTRGVAFATVIDGISRAQRDAEANLGVRSNLIMCFLRDMSAESAAEHLAMAEPYYDQLIGVGLDSDEQDNPPLKFADVFATACKLGMKLTMHCDVDQQDSASHIRDCVMTVGVDRIDHGVNSLEDEALCQEIIRRNLGLTVCPISNTFCAGELKGEAVREMLAKGMRVTVNSDDPAYFGGYMTDNFKVLQDKVGLTDAEALQLSRNAFDVSWLADDDKGPYLAELDQFERDMLPTASA
ncbi:MAG: adenosine deaminase [Pseudomonadota bacterium]